MRYGYCGRALWVNLTSQAIWSSRIPDHLLQEYIGGEGLGLALLEDLGEEDKGSLVLATGPLSGWVGSDRLALTYRHPHTLDTVRAGVRGGIARAIRACGYDLVVIRGKSTKPVLLWLCNGALEIRPISGQTDPAPQGEDQSSWPGAGLLWAGGRPGKMEGVMAAKKLVGVVAKGSGEVAIAAGGVLATLGQEVYPLPCTDAGCVREVPHWESAEELVPALVGVAPPTRPVPLDLWAQMLTAATGVGYNADDLVTAATAVERMGGRRDQTPDF